MSLFRNTFDGGLTGAGETGRITQANSAFSGTGLGVVVDSTEQRWNYATHPLNPAKGLVASRTLDATAGHLRGEEVGATGRSGGRRSLYTGNVPAAGVVVYQGRVLSGEVNVYSVNFDQNRCLSVNLSTGFLTGSISPALPADTLVWIESFYTPPVAPATTGTIEVYAFDDSGTQLYYRSQAAHTQTSPIGQHRFGGHATSGGRTVDWTEEIAWGSVASGPIGPPAVVEPYRTATYYNGSWHLSTQLPHLYT